MNTMVSGLPGTGKTLWMSIAAVIYHHKGFNIFSNYTIRDPITGMKISKDIQTMDDLNKAHDGMLFLDEMMVVAGGRKSNTIANELVMSALTVNRKRKLSLMYSIQDSFSQDILLRANTEWVCLPDIHYIDPRNGRDMIIKQDLFNPIDQNLYLPFAYLHVDLLPAGKFFTGKATMKDIVGKYDLKIEPFVNCYSTTQEIGKLVKPGEEKGNLFENKCLELLIEKHPNITWINRASDKGQPTKDLEGWYQGELKFIIDCEMSTFKKKGTHLVDFSKKNLNNFKEIEEKRHAKTFFMSNIDDKVYTFPVSYLWQVPEGFETFVKPKSKSLESIINKGITEYIGQIS